MRKMSDAVEKRDMEAYSKITDEIFTRILYSTQDELKESREILRRVQKRSLYKFVNKTIVKGRDGYKTVINK